MIFDWLACFKQGLALCSLRFTCLHLPGAGIRSTCHYSLNHCCRTESIQGSAHFLGVLFTATFWCESLHVWNQLLSIVGIGRSWRPYRLSPEAYGVEKQGYLAAQGSEFWGGAEQGLSETEKQDLGDLWGANELSLPGGTVYCSLLGYRNATDFICDLISYYFANVFY